MESSIAVFLGWKPWFAGHCKHATALVNHTLVQKKDADHALQHRPQATYVCWMEARDSPLMAVTTESHKDASYGG